MDRFIIEGGRPLKGKIPIDGVKNVILPMMCASLLTDSGVTVINNVPYLHDIRVLQRLLCELGCEVTCEIGCEVTCEVGCEVTCQTGCEVSCQTGCEVACQAACELQKQGGC